MTQHQCYTWVSDPTRENPRRYPLSPLMRGIDSQDDRQIDRQQLDSIHFNSLVTHPFYQLLGLYEIPNTVTRPPSSLLLYRYCTPVHRLCCCPALGCHHFILPFHSVVCNLSYSRSCPSRVSQTLALPGLLPLRLITRSSDFVVSLANLTRALRRLPL